MSAIATFDYAAWIALYPEFATVPAPRATLFWNEATIYHRNDGSLPASITLAIQQSLLFMVTAHIAQRYATKGGVAPSDLVGRISDATEGSVSVSADMGQQSPNAAWWLQTKYGADYWQATAAFRTLRYRSPVCRTPALPWNLTP